jgi:hypothetical protein
MFSLTSMLDLMARHLSTILSTLVIHSLEPTTLLLLVEVLALVMLGIFLVPKDHVCSRTAEYAQPHNKLWNALVEFGAYPRWRSNVTKVEVNPPGHIPPDGFEWFREFTPHGNIKFRVIERWEDKLLKREVLL